jgi:hypothetical protein
MGSDTLAGMLIDAAEADAAEKIVSAKDSRLM